MENQRLLAHSLALYSATSLPDALRMTGSEAEAFFEGKAYADWRKGKEQELKLQAAVSDRLNGVIRACGAIVKTVASLGRR
ncbi:MULTISPECIES: hypothetical protein [Halomonas]|uniref:Uncharacterized protein n=1 Tax=Halomonas salipaludis TaxID=2032625 RepID=A0A2A2F3J3_9GAMM|nr:hypothetical protein [Halomonas salipaludis]PAU79227.1 hypothetical protein CK498_02330 [Halomonas salipaludis]